MLRLIRYSLLIVVASISFAHSQTRTCQTMDYLQLQQNEDPLMQQRMEAIERFTQNYVRQPNSQRSVITIPIVFHVVYQNSTENISDAQILSQLDVLNEDFRRQNSDADNTWSQAADTEIQFCLAKFDPNGNPTTGITRTSTTVVDFDTDDDVKYDAKGGKDAWPADLYMNFWICNLRSGLLGYAQFPGGLAETDGVVCSYKYTGTSGTATAPFDGGRTATHEVGHYLNLRHIWGDGNCSADDFVDDTPESDASNAGCQSSHWSCNTLDMVQNYMDYSDDACMNLFTEGQKDRMQALFEVGGARHSLVNSPVCTGPPASCNGTEIRVSIVLDNYPSETSWILKNSSGTTVSSGGNYTTPNTTVNVDVCLPDGCYDFIIYDAYGDGICCGYGNGSYAVLDGGAILASGGSFGKSESKNFCLASTPTPTCTDGQQNGDETGVDCGGTTCPPCAPTGCADINEESFESGWGIWNDGGSDCYRIKSRPNTGSYSIRLRDNSGSISSMTTDALALDGNNQITIDFSYYASSMENGEDFWYDVSTNNGATWFNVKNWVRGVDFNNNQRKNEQVVASGNFTNQTKLRIRCDASSNADYIYIDDVKIKACVTSGNRENMIDLANLTPVSDVERRPSNYTAFTDSQLLSNLVLYPNPTTGLLNIRFELNQSSGIELSILDITGRTVKQTITDYDKGNQFIKLDASHLVPGCYFLKLTNGEQHFIEKFIIVQE